MCLFKTHSGTSIAEIKIFVQKDPENKNKHYPWLVLIHYIWGNQGYIITLFTEIVPYSLSAWYYATQRVLGIIRLTSKQNFRKTNIFLPPDTHTYVLVFSGNFAYALNEWSPMILWLTNKAFFIQNRRKILQWRKCRGIFRIQSNIYEGVIAKIVSGYMILTICGNKPHHRWSTMS